MTDLLSQQKTIFDLYQKITTRLWKDFIKRIISYNIVLEEIITIQSKMVFVIVDHKKLLYEKVLLHIDLTG